MGPNLVPVGYKKPEKPIDLSSLGLGQIGTDRSLAPSSGNLSSGPLAPSYPVVVDHDK